MRQFGCKLPSSRPRCASLWCSVLRKISRGLPALILLKRYAGRGLIRYPGSRSKESHFLLIMYTLVAATAPLTSQTTVFVMYFGLLGAQAEKELCGGCLKHYFESCYSHSGLSALFKKRFYLRFEHTFQMQHASPSGLGTLFARRCWDFYDRQPGFTTGSPFFTNGSPKLCNSA